MTAEFDMSHRRARLPRRLLSILDAHGYFSLAKTGRVALLDKLLDEYVPPSLFPEDDEDFAGFAWECVADRRMTVKEAVEYVMGHYEAAWLARVPEDEPMGLTPEARVFSLRYKLTQEDGGWVAEDLEGLGFLGHEEDGSAESAVWSMLCDLSFAFKEYGMAPDSGLVESAQELKRRLLAKFGLVAEEDKGTE